MKIIIIITLGFLLIVSPVSVAQQDNSLFKQAQKNYAIKQSKRNVPAGVKKLEDSQEVTYSTTPSAFKANWISVSAKEFKNFLKNDLITIVVNESSVSSTKSESKMERETVVDLSFDAIMEFSNFRPQPDPRTGATPKTEGKFTRDFDGTGEAKRSDLLRVRIQATVVDVLPNGTLVIEAQKTIVTDAEKTEVTLSGVCNSIDVSAANVIDSSLIANLVVKKTHKGMAKQATKRGLFIKLWDAICLF